jgi:hypothetical protein
LREPELLLRPDELPSERRELPLLPLLLWLREDPPLRPEEDPPLRLEPPLLRPEEDPPLRLDPLLLLRPEPLLLRLDPLLLRPELRPPLRDEPLLLRDEPPVLREELRDEALRLDPLLRDELPLLRDELLLRLRDRVLEPLELDRLRLVVLRRERDLVRSSRGISARTTSLTRRPSSESRNFAMRSSSRLMLRASCAVSRSPTSVASVSMRL